MNLGAWNGCHNLTCTFDPTSEEILFIPRLIGGQDTVLIVEFLHIATGKLRNVLTVCSRLAVGLRDWLYDPSFMNETEARGLKLMKDWLTDEQLAQYDKHNYFDVTGCHSGKRYRIRHGTGANVYELDDAGRPRAGWCFVPKDYLVAGDVMLAQKIALETDERGTLAVANNFLPR